MARALGASLLTAARRCSVALTLLRYLQPVFCRLHLPFALACGECGELVMRAYQYFKTR